MNVVSRDSLGTLAGFGALLEAVPAGLAVYDADKRLTFVNPAYYEVTGVPVGAFLLGSELADHLRILAYRGLFGPGDREGQVAELLRLDLTKPHQLRRRRTDGRSFETSYVPLETGGHMVCVTDTTHLVAQRERAEQDASQSHLAVSNLRNGLAVFGADRRLLMHNRRFAELIGLPARALQIGQTFWELLQQLHEQEDYATYDGELFLAAQISLDRARPHQTRRVRNNGQSLDIASDPLPNGGWTITLTDVSALSRAEDEARRQADQLDGIVRRVPHGICVWGSDRRVALFNRAYSDIMRGAPLRIGDHLEDVVRQRAEAGEWGAGDKDTIISQQMAFDLSRPQSRRRRRPNGTTVDIRTTPLPDGGHISVVTDVTSLVDAEYEASRRASEMDAMLGGTRHGIILWGPDKRIVAFNHIAETVQELRPGALVVGRSFEDIVDELRASGAYGSPEEAESYIAKLVNRDLTRPHKRQRLLRSGRVLEIHGNPTPNGGWVATYTDVTERRATETQLLEAKEAAAAAGKAKTRFLATMSHELRTPLNAVIGFSDTLVRSAQDGTANLMDMQEYAQAINGSGRQLLGLIDTILDVARLEAGQFDLAADRVEVSYIVRTCVAQAQAAAQAAGVAITVELPQDLPLLRADERRMRQVLSHLLSNALKFTERQGNVTVFAQWAPAPMNSEATSDRDLLLCLADSGIGIPEADLERVFEPFTQVDATLARRIDGTGLGLYICRLVMRAHGGDLELHSRMNEGTTAVLRLPSARLLPVPPPAPPTAIPSMQGLS